MEFALFWYIKSVITKTIKWLKNKFFIKNLISLILVTQKYNFPFITNSLDNSKKINTINMKSFDKKYCDQVQTTLTFQKIENIWKTFRQAGNSIQGKIIKMNFKKVLNKHNFSNQPFLDKLFERFKLDKISDLKQQQKQQRQQRMDKSQKIQKQRQEIDLQDFVIGLTILSRLSFINKVKYVFELTDLDQDGCLSLEEIQAMIERIERVFCKENSAAKVNSYWLLLNMAQKRAERNYAELLFLLKKNNPALTNDQQGLITCDQFIEALKSSRNLYTQENFLPLNLSLYEILTNIASQPTIKINQEFKTDFCEFRKQIGSILQNKSDKQTSNLIKYPGKVEIIRNDKVVEILPAIQSQQKKYNKAATKKHNVKVNNTVAIHNDFKDLYDQKLAQQTLDSYKLKVKKMIQTKTDPRLNAKFDREVRK